MNQEIVWNYGAGVACKNYPPRNEKILWYVKDPECYTFNLDDIRDPDVKYPNSKKNGVCEPIHSEKPFDVLQIAKVTSGTNRSAEERTEHPAQFPEDLVTALCRVSPTPMISVLDPFMAVARQLVMNTSACASALKSTRLIAGRQ